MKKIIVFLVVVGVVVGGVLFYNRKAMTPKVGGYFFTAPTMATSSIGSATQTLVLSADAARSYASFCNSSTTIASYISLQIGATSTSPSGRQIPGGSCFEMSPENGNLFTGNIYAQTTAGTSTLTIISTSKAN